MTKVSDIGERQLIDRIAAIMDVNVRDDCAILSTTELMREWDNGIQQRNPTPAIVLTTDMLHRTTDFPDGMPYADIGWMSVAVSLSDIASMGARPAGVMAALGIPPSMDVRDVEDIAKGMAECAQKYNTSIIGGDTDSHDELTIVTSAIGLCENGNIIKRGGAKVGDIICVCKTLGGADAALRLLGIGIETRGERGIANNPVNISAEIPNSLLASLYRPAPCVFEGIALAQTGVVTSMMDISDGLSLSLKQLSDASHVGFEIEQSAVPVHPDAESILGYDEALECALCGGGDFGLLFTIKADGVDIARKACSKMYAIGKVLEYGEIVLKHNDTCTPFGVKGYEHFKTRT